MWEAFSERRSPDRERTERLWENPTTKEAKRIIRNSGSGEREIGSRRRPPTFRLVRHPMWEAFSERRSPDREMRSSD
jgi:hypothetical protein